MFRRQVVLRGYIADFYACAARVVVEVDGAWHGQRAAADRRRDRVLEAFGYRVVRVPHIRRARKPIEQHIRAVVALVENPSRGADLPLDIQGTAFQERVWRALRNIAAGTTRTYSELARVIGAPRAVRAVASACGANELAVVIPCHRVVGKSGKLSGYRWGVERKRALLEREGQ